MELPKVTEETIKEHRKAIEKSKKLKKFKQTSNEVFESILKENPELSELIIETLGSRKSRKYKRGYSDAFTTIYDILRRQAKKRK